MVTSVQLFGSIPVPNRQLLNNLHVNPQIPLDSKLNQTSDSFTGRRAASAFLKGLLSPITSLFSSKKNFLVGLGLIVGGAVLCALTGGAILPAFICFGTAFGAIQATRGVHCILTAKNSQEIETGIEKLGESAFCVVSSYYGATNALRCAGYQSVGINRTQAVLSCFRNLPSSLGRTFMNLRYGRNYLDPSCVRLYRGVQRTGMDSEFLPPLSRAEQLEMHMLSDAAISGRQLSPNEMNSLRVLLTRGRPGIRYYSDSLATARDYAGNDGRIFQLDLPRDLAATVRERRFAYADYFPVPFEHVRRAREYIPFLELLASSSINYIPTGSIVNNINGSLNQSEVF